MGLFSIKPTLLEMPQRVTFSFLYSQNYLLDLWERSIRDSCPLNYEKPNKLFFIFSSVQFSRSVVSDTLQPHESQHAKPPCPSPTPGVYSKSFILGTGISQ